MTHNNWTTFSGKKVSFDTIDHQHLSNCYWFAKIIYDFEDKDPHLIKITDKLSDRFNGQLLPYRPHLEFKAEIDNLKMFGLLSYDNLNQNRLIIKDSSNQEIGEIICPPTKMIKL